MMTSDSELDDNSLSPEQAKLSRKTARNKFTRLTTSIGNNMVSQKNKDVIREQQLTLTELYEECMRMHTIVAAATVDGEDVQLREKMDKWSKDLDDAYRQLIVDIDAYVAGQELAENQAAQQKKAAQEEADAVLAQQLSQAQKNLDEAKAAAEAADNLLAQQLANSQKELHLAKAATEAAAAKAAEVEKSHAEAIRNSAHLTSVIDNQREALKRRHQLEDAEIAKKRAKEDEDREAARVAIVNGLPSQHQPPRMPITSTPYKKGHRTRPPRCFSSE